VMLDESRALMAPVGMAGVRGAHRWYSLAVVAVAVPGSLGV
jgi:hypothetical protein